MKYYYVIIHSVFNGSYAYSYYDTLDEASMALIQLYQDFQRKNNIKTKVIHETKFIIVNENNITTDIYEIVILPDLSH